MTANRIRLGIDLNTGHVMDHHRVAIDFELRLAKVIVPAWWHGRITGQPPKTPCPVPAVSARRRFFDGDKDMHREKLAAYGLSHAGAGRIPYFGLASRSSCRPPGWRC